MRIQEYLDQKHVPFNSWQHATTFSAQRMARSLDVPGENVAKSVLLKAETGFALAVLPATCRIDLRRAATVLDARWIRLASEEEIAEIFVDCELGAVPPFGSCYGLPTLVDDSLRDDEYIVFEANRHDEAVTMRFQDYTQIEQPRFGAFSRHIS